MIKALVAMTTAYVVLGGAVALGFLSIAAWICALLLLAAVLGGLSVVTGMVARLRRLAPAARLGRRFLGSSPPPRFHDDGDYLDWAHRRGRWARRTEMIPPSLS